MSVNVLYTVRCDRTKDDQPCSARLTGDTAWEARDEARAAGWTCGQQMRSRDLCPKHAKPSAIAASADSATR